MGSTSSTVARALPVQAALAERCDALAFALIGVLPLAMALVNKSAQPILIGAMLSALSARAASGEIGRVRDRLTALLRTPIAAAAIAFVAWAAVTIAWSETRRASFGAYGEWLGALIPALVLHAALPARAPRWFWKLATITIAIGCLSIIAELSTGMALRMRLGVRSVDYIFKRSVTAILILAWPIAASLWLDRRRGIALALGLLFSLATYEAYSSTTALALVVGLGWATLAALRPRLAGIGLAAALVLAFAIAPVLGDAARKVMSSSLVERLHFAHAGERIVVWEGFGEVVRRRPLTGTGFGTSPVIGQQAVARELPEERRSVLVAWHPHNAYLQVWVETGPLGVLLAAAALVSAALALRRLPAARVAPAAALLGSALVVMLVGHGLWQGWWTTVLGASALAIARLPPSLARDQSGSGSSPRKPVAST